MTAATATSDIAAVARDVHQALLALREAESREERVTKNLESARDVTARRRLDLGRELVRARAFWPARGPKAKGWGDFLFKLGIEQQRAWEHMKLAGYVEEVSPQGGEMDRVPTLAEAGAKAAPHLRLVPQAEDADEGDSPALDFEVPSSVIDRGGWCTPNPWAQYVGRWDLDPYSNLRSHIVSAEACMLENGGDGFGDKTPGSYRVGATGPIKRATKNTRVWFQPDYGYVLEAIAHYGHTRFGALLRLDTSTDWFEQLWSLSELIMIPKGTRLEFDPPPGVTPSSNPYPHGFFYRRLQDCTDDIASRCFEWRVRK